MRIEKITTDKKRFLELLLLGDEQEDMIDRYLERGDLFALFDPDLKSLCVVTTKARNVRTEKSGNLCALPRPGLCHAPVGTRLSPL